MENGQAPIASLVDKAETFGKTSYELFRLKALDKSADVVSSVVAHLPAALAAIFFIFLLSTGASLWLGVFFKNNFSGFFVVASFYFVAGIVLFLFRKRWIKRPLNNSIIRSALN